MTRPSLPNIGWDPTPGDVEQTRALSKQIGGLASELGTALRELEQIECGAWKGEAAIAFSDHVAHDVTPLIKKSHESFDKASRALHRWAGELQHYQDETDRLEKEAGKKLDHLADVKAKDDGKGSKDVGDASTAVDDVINKVRDLETRYAQAAANISRELDKAGDVAPDEPGLFDKILGGVKGAVDWVKDHADVIALIGDLLSDLTGILGFLAIITMPFEPLGMIFATAALVTSGLALVTHLVAKAAGADVSWFHIALDAVGLLPGIGAFGQGAKVANLATATERAAKLGTAFKASRLASAKNIFAMGEMADQVTGGIRLGRKVVLGGTASDLGLITHESSGFLSRVAGMANAGYRDGQFIGSKGWNLITGKAANPTGALAMGFDAGVKILPKLHSIPQHIGEAVHPGDRFHQAS